MSRGSIVSETPSLCRFRRVSKWYGAVIALNDVSFALRPGITGLVGPNGAGKSTLIKLLTGQLRPSLGEVRVQDVSAWSAAARSYIGYCPDADAFYEEMSGRAFVRFMARLRGYRRNDAHERSEAALQQVEMTDRADRKLGSYSKGMRQRIKLAQAIVHDPDVVVLDEPLNGVDPVGRAQLVRVFRQLADAGKAILISSHILDEMDTLADQVMFICRGRMLASGTLEEIREMLEDHPLKVRINAKSPRELAGQMLRLNAVRGVQLEPPQSLLLEVERPGEFFPELARLAAKEDYEIEKLEVVDASTEAVFDYLLRQAGQ
ncbi:MAG: ABC transporter ATP-binding protein [Planctomycetaceae bacterium]|jgi:ABC-2 type transport system ATP-binding protein|nr:ABC transporter ATP-binding protein [Planctomycetaceae bacterium]MBT6486748.1 ABC transporter ATP-binding protein [Planctomycetaceae bacterium]MBT6493560.1 ABC transporter ATP-binding protein [Planctomycetaceae bacterium]